MHIGHKAPLEHIKFAGHHAATWQDGKRERSPIPKTVVNLFLAMAAYVSFPIFHVTIIDVSFSAILFFFIAVNIFMGGHKIWQKDIKKWVFIALAFWMGIFLSLVVNSIMETKSQIDVFHWRIIIKYIYWMIIFITTIYIVSQADIGPKIIKIFIVMVFVAAVARWGEAIIFGRVGAWSGAAVLHQNTYGLMFSRFCPFLMLPLLSGKGRWLALPMALVVWGAMLINGSRGSFITVPLGIGLMVTLYLISQPGRRRALAGIISTGMLLAILGAVLLISPAKYSAPVTDRLDTFQNLDRDKTFGGRIAVARKGWSMFLEAPFFGYGIGTFAKTFVEFELPEQLEGKTLGAQNRVASHNVYTTLMGETGLIGVIPFACLILLLVFQGGKATLVLARRGEVWALGVYVSFLMMSVHFWAISGLGNTSTWMIYGMVAAIIVLAKKRLPDGEAESGARSEGNRAIGRRPGAARYPSS